MAADAAWAEGRGAWPLLSPKQSFRPSFLHLRKRSGSVQPGPPRSLFSPSIRTAHAAPGSSEALLRRTKEQGR